MSNCGTCGGDWHGLGQCSECGTKGKKPFEEFAQRVRLWMKIQLSKYL